ncbi:DNA-binding protein, partial [Pallidibacillus thermolactis]|uniref:DNA-binding protein n=1 Tax=Pallidibacillus thermolactis TaxID=251051 RepID=UPI002E239F4C|nr:DNA-binding protein [Pallidibacillus thermolactis subsp. kokeshiiformis]
ILLDAHTFRELKKLLANSVSFTDAIKAVISMDLEDKNASLTPSVFKQELRLSKSELQEIVHQEVKRAIEEELEGMLKAFEYKLENLMETRDRLLVKELQHSLEEKRLEIAETKQEKKAWWKNG